MKTTRATIESRSFGEFVSDKVGPRWVVAPRLSQRLKDKGYTVALTQKRYTALEREWEIERYGAPLYALQDAAPDLLSALKGCVAALQAHVICCHARDAAFHDPKVFARPMDWAEVALNGYAAAGSALPAAHAAIAKATA